MKNELQNKGIIISLNHYTAEALNYYVYRDVRMLYNDRMHTALMADIAYNLRVNDEEYDRSTDRSITAQSAV